MRSTIRPFVFRESFCGIINPYGAGKQASIAKITRPGVAGVFLRSRLFNLLDRGRDSSILFITSPPGSGKTTLIASYLDDRKLPCLWYEIDEGDADIATFFHYMGFAAKKLAVKKRKPLPVFTPEFIHGARIFSRRYFEDLFSRVKAPFIFVFDSYQDVPGNTEFHEMISYGLANIPGGINVIISSRKGPPLPFAHMYASETIHLLGWDAIKFTLEETAAFVQMRVSGKLSDETIHYLHKKTDGWAAGLVLMLERFKKENVEFRTLDQVSSSNIFDYFAYEIFQKVDRDIQEFLLKTAFFPTMTAQMAKQLTGIHRSEEILNSLSKDHYFTEMYSEDRSVYHYHPLFREFLLSRAEGSFAPADLSLIKQNAAQLIEKSGRVENAVQLLQASGDVKNLIRIIQNWAQSLIEQGRYQTLLNWLDFLPKEFLSNDPWLLYWMGLCRLPFNPGESLIHFEVAFRQFKSQKDARGSFLAWSGIVESILYGYEGLKPLDRWFPIIYELVKEFKGFPSEDTEANVTCSMVRALALRRPAGIDMKKWVDRVETIAQTSKDIPVKIRALINLACYLYSEGKFQKLGIILDSLQEFLKRQDIPPLVRLTTDWVKAAYFNAMSQYDQCQKVVTDGLHLAQSIKISVMEHMLLGHGVLSSLKESDFETAKRYLQRMASALNFLKPWEASFYHYCSAWEALYRNDLALAFTHSEHCMRLCEIAGNPWTLSNAHILKAYISYAFGEPERCDEHVMQARSTGVQSKNEFTPFVCSLTEAYFYLKKGKEKQALEAIREGLEIGRKKGFVNIFMCPQDVMKTILAKALECGIEETYVRNLIQRNAVMPDASSLEIETWPWPLKVFTFGRFGLVKHGKPVQFSGKIQHRPLSLFKALIAFGGRGVSEDHLVDILWPESEGDAAHSAFTTTLSRLRHLLGIEQAIKFHEGKVVIDPRCCWVDIWAFERIIGHVDKTWKEEATENHLMQAVKTAEKALKLYTGPFLSGDNEPWMISVRERLRNKFLRNVRRIGYFWEQIGELGKAVECYQKGLEVDDLVEEFYQRLMKCHQRMGKRAEAIAVYKRCCHILSSVLEIEPSPETKAIYRELLS